MIVQGYLKQCFHRFMREEDGATAIEYSIMAAILAIAIIGTVGSIRDELEETFESVGGELAANNTTP
jgi:pilus assembly protein Flp/PilA